MERVAGMTWGPAWAQSREEGDTEVNLQPGHWARGKATAEGHLVHGIRNTQTEGCRPNLLKAEERKILVFHAPLTAPPPISISNSALEVISLTRYIFQVQDFMFYR